MAPVQKLNDFKLMLFVLFFTLTIIYTCMHSGADLGQNFRGRQELWNNFAINDRGKFLVLML